MTQRIDATEEEIQRIAGLRKEWARSGEQDFLADRVILTLLAQRDAANATIQRLQSSPAPVGGGVPELPESVLVNIEHHWPEDYGRRAQAITEWFQRHSLPAPGAGGGGVSELTDALLPCPFCGKAPVIEPKDPERSGDAWATVFCPDEDCPGNHGANVTNESGHLAAVAAASAVWNRRIASRLPALKPGEVEEFAVFEQVSDSSYDRRSVWLDRQKAEAFANARWLRDHHVEIFGRRPQATTNEGGAENG